MVARWWDRYGLARWAKIHNIRKFMLQYLLILSERKAKKMPENQFDVTEHFGTQYSSIYDNKIRKVIPGYQAMHEMAQFLLADNLPSSASILVAGVGTGQEAISYATNHAEWHIIGFDPTEAMLSIASTRVRDLVLSDRISLVQGFIDDVDVNQRFDAATSILVMQFLPDNGEKQAYLKEISKRLSVGAKFILVDLEGDQCSDNFNLLMSAWKAHQYGTREDTEQVKVDFEHINRDLHFVPSMRIEALLNNAGFTEVQKFYKAYLFGGYIATKQ